MKCDLKSGRTPASSFLANFARLLLTAGEHVLHQQLRLLGLQGTAPATAQPVTVILSLFKVAARVKQQGASKNSEFAQPQGAEKNSPCRIC